MIGGGGWPWIRGYKVHRTKTGFLAKNLLNWFRMGVKGGCCQKQSRNKSVIGGRNPLASEPYMIRTFSLLPECKVSSAHKFYA